MHMQMEESPKLLVKLLAAVLTFKNKGYLTLGAYVALNLPHVIVLEPRHDLCRSFTIPKVNSTDSNHKLIRKINVQ